MSDNDQNQGGGCKIDIVESYRDYTPPIPVRAIVERLLARMPDKYKWGLKTIVLTDAASLSRSAGRGKLKSRNKRVHQRECLGMYMQKWKGEPAWIRLVVDNVLAEIPWYAKRIPIGRDAALGSVLYHEFGHHIHKTKKPEFKEKEDVADKWSDKLLVAYLRKQYWYFRPILMPIAYTFKLARKLLARFLPTKR